MVNVVHAVNIGGNERNLVPEFADLFTAGHGEGSVTTGGSCHSRVLVPQDIGLPGTSRVLLTLIPAPAAVGAVVDIGAAESTGNQLCLIGVAHHVQAEDVHRLLALAAGSNAGNIEVNGTAIGSHVDIATLYIYRRVRVPVIGNTRVLINHADKQGLAVLPVIGEANPGGEETAEPILTVPQQLGKLVPAADGAFGVNDKGALAGAADDDIGLLGLSPVRGAAYG